MNKITEQIITAVVQENVKQKNGTHFDTAEEAKKVAFDILNKFASLSKRLVQENEEHKADSSSMPSAPDTSKFRSTVSGMIDYMAGESIGGSYYEGNHYMTAGVKVGGAVDIKIHRAIKNEVNALFVLYHRKYQGESSWVIQLRFPEGYFQIRRIETEGTNWSAFGIEVQELDKLHNSLGYFKAK